MKKSILILLVLIGISQTSFAKTYSTVVEGALSDLAKSKIEGALNSKFNNTIKNVTIDSFNAKISFDGPEFLKTEDINAALESVNFKAKK